VLQNPLLNLWKRDATAFTGWLTIPSAWTAEVMTEAGFDALVVDLQHGLMDYAGMLAMLQAVGPVPALVRASWNEPGILMRALDAGAYGIICPMISTREACEAFVAACRYPPRGIRSFGPTRSLVSIGSDYVAQADSFALTFALIETAEGLAHVDAIARVPGLTGLYLGPWDLSLDLGLPNPGNLLDEKLSRACDILVETAHRHNLIAGIYTGSAEDGCRMAARGFRLVNVASDTALLQRSAAAELRKVRELSNT
jgi:4-hydroxy-2-oxoheptanedioate aldolase